MINYRRLTKTDRVAAVIAFYMMLVTNSSINTVRLDLAFTREQSLEESSLNTCLSAL